MNTNDQIKKLGIAGSLVIFVGAGILMHLQTKFVIPWLSRITGMENIFFWFVIGGLGIFLPLILLGIFLLKKEEVLTAEKAFEAMAAEKSIAEAFAWFAAEDAVIKRGNDSIISGREGIRNYYNLANLTRAAVSWTPDRIDVSADGTMAWTYGKYVWKVIRYDGDTVVSRGIFHTVWKRQADGSWKYVWD
ncbi:MAG: nuclear transport factor 2 family protein [Bacteroidales bacterium]|nr:nuclear transport factor 2 family protein [Bacteroidales bacterium]